MNEHNAVSGLYKRALIKEKQEVDNKTKEEATMLLNHKDAITYLMENNDLAKTLNLLLSFKFISVIQRSEINFSWNEQLWC